MVDINKRKVLKLFGGTAAIAAVPAISSAYETRLGAGSEAFSAAEQNVAPATGRSEMAAEFSMDPEPQVKLTNNSARPVLVRHVHPGIVHAGAETYDLNSIFENGALSIEPGASVSVKIGTTYSTQAETAFPRHLFGNKPQRVISVTGANSYGKFVHSSRSFYS